MAVLSLPLSFTNSFWSQDYRRGLQVLFDKLEQGAAENDEIVAFIKARAAAESYLASSLINPAPTGKSRTGFAADDGASLFMAFRGLQAESAAQGQAHHIIAKELTTLVADPFEDWARGYKERLKQNKTTVLDNWIRSYEQGHSEVSKLKHTYLQKVRRADEAEDDAKFFVTNSPTGDKYTNSPRIRPADRAPPQRTASVSERIAQRLKEIQKKSVDALAQATTTEDPNASPEPMEEKPLPTVDKGKGKEVADGQEPPQLASPPPMSPIPPPKELPTSLSRANSAPTEPILVAGLALMPAVLSQLLHKAVNELPLRPVRFPLLGEYQDAFTGEEFTSWLQANVPGLGGSLDKAEEAARDLTEREGLLRRLGELGNQFEDSDDSFYQFRPKAFELDRLDSSRPQSENVLKKTGNLYSLVSKVLTNPSTNGEPVYIRARQEASEAERNYRIAIRRLDRQRLGLEERLEETLKVLQRWEAERLRAVKTVLLQYQGTLSNLPKSLEPSLERSTTLIAAFQPESDLQALIERYRTGPFRPEPQVYESAAHEENDVVFGIDLRRWAEGGWYALMSGHSNAPTPSGEGEAKKEKKDPIPPVLTALLSALDSAYARAPSDAEKRKAWIYEVPLPAVHHLRETLNGLPLDQPYPAEVLEKFDAPVLAAAVKLWALELNPPLGLYEGWEDFRKLYQAKKTEKIEGEEGDEAKEREQDHVEKVASVLLRLPRVHLYVLDAILKHLTILVATTKVEESDEVYYTKLALSMGRTILRPKVETELSVQDRHATSLFLDLITRYDALLPPTIARKKRESERKVPIRKRTAPIDMRLSRSSINRHSMQMGGADAAQLLAAQQLAQNPSLANKSSIRSPELPSLPPPAGLSHRRMASGQAMAPPPPPPPQAVAPPPPPPPAVKSVPPPPPPPASVPAVPPPPPLASQPPRPAFKDPSPEFDDVPSRPHFKEPPPEHDDLPPRPTFADPPPEDSDAPAPPVTTNVIPPTPRKTSTATPTKIASRSPSPPTNAAEDVVLGSGKSSISRSGSAQSGAGAIRGPRMARTSRVGSGSVQSLVQNLNRNSVTGSPTPGGATSPKSNRFSSGSGHVSTGSSGGSPVRRPSSIVGRSAAGGFSRRTMASDAEDDVVDRK